tara:strand:- start:807 stop:1034 length:228 start_codon:yes stop_codon:yes gene_type:complete
MSKHCIITNKKTITGNNVSHANNRNKRKFYPNLQTKRFWSEEQGKWIKLKVSTSGMRMIDKLGLDTVLTKVQKDA